MKVTRFDHIVINCSDVETTAAWYERVLGMTRETFGPAGRTALTFGAQKINLRPITATQDEWFTGVAAAAGRTRGGGRADRPAASGVGVRTGAVRGAGEAGR